MNVFGGVAHGGVSLLVALSLAACDSGPSSGRTVAPALTSAAQSGALVGAPAPPAHHRPPAQREGNALARAVAGDALLLADEDHGVVRRIRLPPGGQVTAQEMPGRPAQVLPLDGRVLVTIRDPGLLLVLKSEGEQIAEATRIAVPGDAWGIAISADEKLALVTSAWSHAVTAIDLEANKVLWAIDVAREPRGVVIAPDASRAYVTHLIGDRVTRIDDLRGSPRVATFALQIPFASRDKPPKARGASSGGGLAYSAVLSPDGSRLLVPRHGIGGLGPTEWFGTPQVDVVWTGDDSLLRPPYHRGQVWQADSMMMPHGSGLPPFVVARSAIYRKSTQTLLLASEATDALLELDARSIVPSEQPLHVHRLGRHYEQQAGAARQGGAPTGIALSEDEKTAYVFCRATYDLVTVPLELLPQTTSSMAESKPAASKEAGPEAGAGDDAGAPKDAGPAELPDPLSFLRIAPDPLGEDESVGRRLFYTAMDPVMTDGVSCATCHPEGRDDGFVWNEQSTGESSGNKFLSVPRIQGFPVKGAPRQTPMLAGRVGSEGPYGWLAESPNLKSRIIAGFGLHRWILEGTQSLRGKEARYDPTAPGDPVRKHRAEHLALFLRRGLVAPPALREGPPEVVARGKQLFEDQKVGCAGCHVPQTDFTNRAAVALRLSKGRPPLFAEGFEETQDTAHRTPSLLFVAGTAPYFHDGSVDTLEELIDKNGDRMGKTAHLSGADKAALVAYLKTIGGRSKAPEGAPMPTIPQASSVAPQASAAPSGTPASSGSAALGAPPRRSRRPLHTDWKDAEPFELTFAEKGCTAQRIREYVRVRCPIAGWYGFTQAYSKGGMTQDVEFWESKFEKSMYAVFPLRPGDRRVLVFTHSIGIGKYEALEVPGRVISATWLAGEDPVVTVD